MDCITTRDGMTKEAACCSSDQPARQFVFVAVPSGAELSRQFAVHGPRRAGKVGEEGTLPIGTPWWDVREKWCLIYEHDLCMYVFKIGLFCGVSPVSDNLTGHGCPQSGFPSNTTSPCWQKHHPLPHLGHNPTHGRGNQSLLFKHVFNNSPVETK